MVTVVYIKDTTDDCRAVAVSKDGKYVVAGSNDYKVRLFTVDGSGDWTYNAGSPNLTDNVAISENGDYLVAGTHSGGTSNRVVILFSKDSSTPLWRYPDTSSINYQVYSVAISGDGNYIFAGGFDNVSGYDPHVWLFSRDSNSPLWEYEWGDNTYDVRAVAVSGDGTYLVAGSDSAYGTREGRVTLWNRSSSTPLWQYALMDCDFRAVAISDDGEYIVAGGENGKVYLFDKDSSTPLWTYDSGGGRINSVAISKDGNYVIVGGDKVYFFERTSGTPLWVYTSSGTIYSVSIDRTGTYAAAGASDGKIHAFARGNSTPVWTYEIESSSDAVRSVAIAVDSTHVAAGDDGAKCRLLGPISLQFTSYDGRIDIWRESLGGIGRFEVQMENPGNIYGGTINSQDLVELKINDISMMKGYIDDVLPYVNDPTAVYHNRMRIVGRDYGQDLVNLFLTKKYYNERVDKIIDDALSTAGAEITYTPNIDKQESSNLEAWLYGTTTRVGQRKTLSNVKVHRLEFYLRRYGTPTGNVTATVRKVSDDSVIQSAVICGASELPTTKTWLGASFTDPPTINEEVRLQVEFSGGDINNCVSYDFQNSDIKSGELYTIYVDGAYTDNAARDGTYRIYLDSWSEKSYEFKRTYLLDGFCDLAKLADGDFYVDDDKALQLFLLASAPSSGITLKSIPGDATNNILSLEQIGEKVGFDIKNYVHIEAGDIDDHWTEGNASDWTAGTGCTVSNETITVLAGNASLKITRSNNGIYEFSMPLSVSKVGYISVDMSAVGDAHFLVYHDFAWPYLFKCRPRLTDGSGNVIEYRSDGNGLSRDTTDEPLDGLWNKVVFPVGEGCEIKASSTDKFWSFITGSAFDWSDIVSIVFTSVVTLTTGSYYFDGLYLPIPARAIRENATSQGSYRKRMISLTRSDIKSQVQLNALAVDELAKRKDPTQKLKVTATFQSGCKYAGQTVMVKAPSSGIGTAETGVTYRILGLHHVAEPRTDLLRGFDAITEFDLVKYETTGVDPLRLRLISNPTWTYAQRLETRLRALEKG